MYKCTKQVYYVCSYCTAPPPRLWSSRAVTPDPTVRMARSTPRTGLCPGYSEGDSCTGRALGVETLGSLTRGCLSHEDARRLKIPRLGIIEGSFKWVNEEVAAVVISQTYYHTKTMEHRKYCAAMFVKVWKWRGKRIRSRAKFNHNLFCTLGDISVREENHLQYRGLYPIWCPSGSDRERKSWVH